MGLFQAGLSFLSGMGGIFLIGVFFYYRKKKAKDNYIPPLDLIDAKKMDDMIAEQVSEALKPILQSEGHSDESIKEILTRTSLGGQKRFSR